MNAIAIVLWSSLVFWVMYFIGSVVERPHDVARNVRPIRAGIAGMMVVLCVAAIAQWWEGVS